MTAQGYPFIDIAALDAVREGFARGDAMLVLSTDLGRFIWANGPGARLFGYPDLEEIAGAACELSVQARRQITGLHGFPEIGAGRMVHVRLASGLRSRTIGFQASAIRLPDGEPGILLALPATTRDSRSREEIAAEAISGIREAGHYAALVDGAGRILAGSAGLDSLGLTQPVLAGLVDEVAQEKDRLIKKRVPSGRRSIPAGFAQLTDDPALHLLVAIDESALIGSIDDSAVTPASGLREEEDKGEPGVTAAGADEREGPVRHGMPFETMAPAAEAPAKEVLISRDETDRAAEAQAEEAGGGEHREATLDEAPRPDEIPPSEKSAEPAGTAEPSTVRFVWRTDADGRFSSISPEFVQAVGKNAADVVGRRFSDVAKVFDLDPDGEIAGLLERRDTWSGRSVLWPRQGTDLRIPVDLAALPVYDRERKFEGFRGFGVARSSDAVVDPDGLGLTLTDGEPETQAGSEEIPSLPGIEKHDPFKGEVPALAIQETPALRTTDKIISLAERRDKPAERDLSPSEKIAFRAIGDRLKQEGLGGPSELETSDFAEHPVTPAEPRQDEGLQTGADKVASEAEPAPGQAVAAIKSEPAAVPPPLASSGFLPSAFPAKQEKQTRAPVQLGVEIATGGATPALLARLPVPVLVTSAGDLRYANREFLALSGYNTLAELQEAGGLAVLFADEVEYNPGEDTGGRALPLLTRDGDVVPVSAHLQSIPWAQGKALLLALRAQPIILAESGNDNEPRRHLLAEVADIPQLQATVEQLTTILDTATDGIVLIDNDGNVRSLNGSAEALFGFDTAEFEGKPFAQLFAVESQRSARDYLLGLSEHGVASVLNDGREVIGREARGRFIPLYMTIGRLPGDSGYCAVMRDITHWKRAEEELTEARRQAEVASKQKTEFLARISHEIRTPLNAIIGFSELMISERFGPIGNERYRDYLQDIKRSGSHVLDLVNDLLDISKIEAGQQEMNYEAVSLNDVLNESVALMQPQANRERVIIRSSFASGLPDVVADLRSIKQIALNLMSNAVKFTQPGGQVIVSTTYEANGDVVMRVRDTGIGMSPSDIELALKPFKQLGTIHRTRGDGTGLGLPLTKAMVEANRAKFSIDSTPGDGTMVEVTFPPTRVLAD